MCGHTRWWLIVLIGLTLGGACFGTAQDPAIVAKYNDKWGAREKQADTTRKRLALVQELMQAAVQTDDKDMRLYIFDKAFFLGLRDYPEGHRLAAQAVHLIQQTDTGMRMDCLMRLDRLYTAGWHINKRSNLGAGIEAAEVKVEMAQRRLMELFREHRTKGLEKIEFIGELNKIKGEYIDAYTTANQVVSTAARYAESHPDKKVREALGKFAAENAPLLDKIKEARDEILDLHRAYALNGDAALPPQDRPGAQPIAEVADATPTTKPETPSKPASKPAPTTRLPDKTPPQPGSAVSTEPEPAPEPATKPANNEPEVENAFTRAISAGHWQEHKCSKCGDTFVPAFGDNSGLCYWCQKKTSIFDVKN
ncbi:MAG: hypothetical protein GC159_22220 [Phycisphaera sp.]|nr:hypothetical protein [Phycisphaera sp.]